MTTPYYQDSLVTLYLGDCREITEWLETDVLVTDPPYGRNWRQGRLSRGSPDAHPGIAGDKDTSTRDATLAMWGSEPAVVFGDPMLPPPAGAKLVGVYQKPPNAGRRHRLRPAPADRPPRLPRLRREGAAVTRDDYLDVLRERYGPDAGRAAGRPPHHQRGDDPLTTPTTRQTTHPTALTSTITRERA